MSGRWRLGVPAVTVVAAVIVAAGAAAPGSSTGPHAGGVYRVAFEGGFSFTDGFDPTGEYDTFSWAIESNLMIRTLVGYDHVAGPAGERLVPDIATAVPAPTGGGRTYTFHLRHGVKFGPPVQSRGHVARTSCTHSSGSRTRRTAREYAFYYSPIAGFDAYAAGKAKSISGIATPDPSTIVFHLTKPTGDFLYRLALPATGPIPVEVARCFEGQAGRYGRDVVSTGPYMIEGADRVDASSCATLKPMSGFDALTSLTLVRNPDYDPKTDSPAARQSFPDEFRFTVNANTADIVDQVAAGDLEDENAVGLPPEALERYARDPARRARLHLDSADRTRYLSMNLTQPPVRRRPRPPGDELDHGQGGAPSGLGRPVARPDRAPHRPRHDVRATSSPSTTRTRPRATAAASRRRSRRCAAPSTTRRTTARAARPRATTSSCSTTPAPRRS